MTALNLVVQNDAAHLLTDRASYGVNDGGRLLRLASKVVTLPALRVAMGVGGTMTAARLSSALRHFSRPAGSAEDLFGQLSVILPVVAAAAEREVGAMPGLPSPPLGQSWADFFVGIAAWNPEEDCSSAYLMVSSPALGIEPFVPFRLNSYFAPGVDLSAALGRPYDHLTDAATFRPETDGIALLEAQRRSTADFGWSAVGGGIELTTVDRGGVRQTILREWPEDRVGERIVLIYEASTRAVG